MAKEEKDFEVIFEDRARAQMDADPELAKAMVEFAALAKQAMAGVESGQYKDFNEGMFILTGNKPRRLEPDDPYFDELSD